MLGCYVLYLGELQEGHYVSDAKRLRGRAGCEPAVMLGIIRIDTTFGALLE
jgi:hypothetical protein